MPLSRITAQSIANSVIITTELLADSSVTNVKVSNVAYTKITGLGVLANQNNIPVANVTGNISTNNNLLAQLHAIALLF